MKLSNNFIAVAGWVIITLCLFGGLGYINADTADEITTAMVMLLLSYYSRLGVFYFAASLALGKVWDGVQSPWEYAPSELIWDICCSLLLILYYYDKWKKKKRLI
jgi:hypothetical protein